MKRYIKPRFVRFLAFGGANTLATYVIYLLCLQWMSYLFAFSVSAALGVLMAYVGNAVFVFRVSLSWRELFQYPLVYVIQYFVGLLLLFVEVRALRFDEHWAPLLNVVILVPLTYLLNRILLIRGKEHV